MEHEPKQPTSEQLRLSHLKQLAWTLFELTDQEDRRDHLAMLCSVVAEAKPLFDDAERELHPDLGLNLLEFVQMKDDLVAGDTALAEGVALMRQATLDALQAI